MIAVGKPLRVTQAERDWAALPHYLFLVCMIASVFAGSWGQEVRLLSLGATALVFWRKPGSSLFVFHHARESLNFQITFLLIGLLFGVAAYLRVGPDNPPGLVLLAIVVYFIVLMLSWKAGSCASKGLDYRYPVCLRFLR
jgi:uncharacterized protein